MLADVRAFAAAGATLLRTADLDGVSTAKLQLALQSAAIASVRQTGAAAALASVSFARYCPLPVEGEGG